MRCHVSAIAVLLGATAMFSACAAAAERSDRPVAQYCRLQIDLTTAYGLIEGDRVRQIEGDLFGPHTPTDKTYALSDVKLMVPTRPNKVLALAGNVG
jgi:hypothetical protein